MRKNPTKTLTHFAEELINFIKALGEFSEMIVFTPYGKLRIGQTSLSRSTYYTKLNKFERAGLLKKSAQTSNVNFVLSPKGRQICRDAIKRERRNDGLSTLIIFDIPIKFNRERTIFRRFVARHGYTQIQKSALVGPWQISAQVRDLAKELKIFDYITIFGVKKDLW